jgi:hypothetical protein
MAWRARDDVGVAGLLQERWGPANFHIHANLDIDIRLAQEFDKARLGFDKMRILSALGKDSYRYSVAPNLTGKTFQFGHCGSNLQGTARPLRLDASGDIPQQGEDEPQDYQ